MSERYEPEWDRPPRGITIATSFPDEGAAHVWEDKIRRTTNNPKSTFRHEPSYLRKLLASYGIEVDPPSLKPEGGEHEEYDASYGVGVGAEELQAADPTGYGETYIGPDEAWKRLIPLMARDPKIGPDEHAYPVDDEQRAQLAYRVLERMEGAPEAQRAFLQRAMAKIGIGGFAESDSAKVYTWIWYGTTEK